MIRTNPSSIIAAFEMLPERIDAETESEVRHELRFLRENVLSTHRRNAKTDWQWLCRA